MKTFIVVHDGAYGISFDIVRAESEEDAKTLVGSIDGYCYDMSEYNNHPRGVVYSEQPTGG